MHNGLKSTGPEHKILDELLRKDSNEVEGLYFLQFKGYGRVLVKKCSPSPDVSLPQPAGLPTCQRW